MKPLVSVIVPIYKTEDYLYRCLNSLRTQSFSAIEVLLVDDASPDRCGEICDEYAAKDSRFRAVHHSENKGLSAARNTGICMAICEWLMFVDSDDWVHVDFVKDSYKCVEKYNADIVVFNYSKIKNEDKAPRHKDSSISEGYITKEQAIDLLLETGFGTIAWNKLYRKNLFNDVRFPEGYLFEDVGTTYKLLYKADIVYYHNKVLYYQFDRQGSITKLKTEKALKDWFKLSMQRYGDILSWGIYPQDKLNVFLGIAVLKYCIKYNLYHLRKQTVQDPNYEFSLQTIRNMKDIPCKLTWRRKVLFLILKYEPDLLRLVQIPFLLKFGHNRKNA